MIYKNILIAFTCVLILSGCGKVPKPGSLKETNAPEKVGFNGDRCTYNEQEKDPACCAQCGLPVYAQGKTMLDGKTCEEFPVCKNDKFDGCIQNCPNIKSKTDAQDKTTSSEKIVFDTNRCTYNEHEKDSACCAQCGLPVYAQGKTMLDGKTCKEFPVCKNDKFNGCIQNCPNIESKTDTQDKTTSSEKVVFDTNRCTHNEQEKDPACCAQCGLPVYAQGKTMLDGKTCQKFPVCKNDKYSGCIQNCPNK